MEIEIIRPLFRQYGIGDVLEIVKKYIEEEPKRDGKYKNFTDYRDILNDKYLNINIHYFGIIFNSVEKRFIEETLRNYLEKITKDKRILEMNKILYNDKLGKYALLKIKEQKRYASIFDHKYYYNIRLILIKKYYGKKTAYSNFVKHYKEDHEKYIDDDNFENPYFTLRREYNIRMHDGVIYDYEFARFVCR